MDNPTPPVARTRSPDWLFWLSWVVASTAAILLGFGIIYASIFLAKAILPGTNEDRLMGGLMFPVLATVLEHCSGSSCERAFPSPGGGFSPQE
jgi:hypothetical protein